MKNDRFIKTFSQGIMSCFEVWVDRETGVNYLYHATGESAGLTVLMGRDGKPDITPIGAEE